MHVVYLVCSYLNHFEVDVGRLVVLRKSLCRVEGWGQP